jgi:hypothetical protein
MFLLNKLEKLSALWIAGPIVLSAIVVFILGTVFYCHGMRATKGRFEHIPGV